MKSYNNLFENMIDDAYIKQCILDASKGKRKRQDVQKVLQNIDTEVAKIKAMLMEERYFLHPKDPVVINESTTKKNRVIVKPNFKYDQIVQHMVVKQLQPIIMHGLYEYSCGSIPGRGVHYAKGRIEKWVNRYGRKRFYVSQNDVRHFFENVDRNILCAMLEKKIRDKKFLRLLNRIIFYDDADKGLPLGFYTSQWFANFYLKDFDHFVKQTLMAEHYIRYMDDMVILGKNKRKLHKMRAEMARYLKDELKLELKDNWQVFRFVNDDETSGRPLDFLGFKFYRGHTTIRKSILKRIRRKAYRINQKGASWYTASQMISYLGWTKNADVYGYFKKHIEPKVNVRKLRSKVSKHNREETKKCERTKQNLMLSR